MSEPLRGHTGELLPDDLGGFECRWYAHEGGRRIQFASMGQVSQYMAVHSLGRPDEFLAPIDTTWG